MSFSLHCVNISSKMSEKQTLLSFAVSSANKPAVEEGFKIPADLAERFDAEDILTRSEDSLVDSAAKPDSSHYATNMSFSSISSISSIIIIIR